MKDYEARCALCGDVMSKYWMEEVNTGRAVHWLCPKCFREGARQADHVTKRSGHPARRKASKKFINGLSVDNLSISSSISDLSKLKTEMT